MPDWLFFLLVVALPLLLVLCCCALFVYYTVYKQIVQIKEINNESAAFAKTYALANTEIDVEAMEVNADLCMPIMALPAYLDSRPQQDNVDHIRIEDRHTGLKASAVVLYDADPDTDSDADPLYPPPIADHEAPQRRAHQLVIADAARSSQEEAPHAVLIEDGAPEGGAMEAHRSGGGAARSSLVYEEDEARGSLVYEEQDPPAAAEFPGSEAEGSEFPRETRGEPGAWPSGRSEPRGTSGAARGEGAFADTAAGGEEDWRRSKARRGIAQRLSHLSALESGPRSSGPQ
ncbi:hypothetical protein T484DRAFT_1783427 [Baffinella frigidus]|nr:hypothetical protein T484DRAFT_1783427 [Cryptophyta sp. CCMP2293]